MKSDRIISRRHGGCRAAFLGLLLVGLATMPSRLDGAEGGMTPELVARLQAVTSAVISPDGALVAYTLAVPRRPFVEEDGPAWQELHVTSADGRSRPFVVGKVNVSQVAWQPDGRGISFLAKRGDDKETALYVIPIDGGEARRALAHPTGIRRYSWSPDGSRVAFLATEPESEELRKRPWDDWEFFLERSPIKHVGGGRTPLLILHGQADPRVHPSQSLEMYRYLRTWTDTPVRLVKYPGEGHGNARAASRLDYQLRMLQWFEHYLLGPGGEPPPHALDYPFEEKSEE